MELLGGGCDAAVAGNIPEIPQMVQIIAHAATPRAVVVPVHSVPSNCEKWRTPDEVPMPSDAVIPMRCQLRSMSDGLPVGHNAIARLRRGLGPHRGCFQRLDVDVEWAGPASSAPHVLRLHARISSGQSAWLVISGDRLDDLVDQALIALAVWLGAVIRPEPGPSPRRRPAPLPVSAVLHHRIQMA